METMMMIQAVKELLGSKSDSSSAAICSVHFSNT